MATNYFCKSQGYGVFGWHGNVRLMAVKVKVTSKRLHQKLQRDLLYFTIISSLRIIYKYFSHEVKGKRESYFISIGIFVSSVFVLFVNSTLHNFVQIETSVCLGWYKLSAIHIYGDFW